MTKRIREWRNFGSNVSWSGPGIRKGQLRAVRHDPTGLVVTPAGPAGRDAVDRAIYQGKDDAGFARYCFGPDYQPKAD